MFCPACGADDQSADAYCKRCGQWLPEMTSLARRALWGQGTTPEQKVNSMLIRDGVTALLALFSAIALYLSLSGGADLVVKIVIGVSLLVAGVQLDSFMVGFRLRQDFKRIHSAAGNAVESSKEITPTALARADTAQLNGRENLREKSTELLSPLPRGQGHGERK